MFNLEEKILGTINLEKGLFGLEPGALILQKVEKTWKPGIIIGSKQQGPNIHLWTAEEEKGKEIKYVCWGLMPKIKIVKNSTLKELTINNLVNSLRQFSKEASKIGIGNILKQASDIRVSQ